MLCLVLRNLKEKKYEGKIEGKKKLKVDKLFFLIL